MVFLVASERSSWDHWRTSLGSWKARDLQKKAEALVEEYLETFLEHLNQSCWMVVLRSEKKSWNLICDFAHNSIPANGFRNPTVVWGQIGLVGLPSKGSNWPLINDWFWSICISNAFKGSRAAGGDSLTAEANPGGGINACWGWTSGVGSGTKFRSRSSTLMAEFGSACGMPVTLA